MAAQSSVSLCLSGLLLIAYTFECMMNRKQRRVPRGQRERAKPGGNPESLARAVELHRQERLDDAEMLYRQVLQRDPHQVEALHFLGVLSAQRGQHPEAITWMRRALALNPRYADAWNNLGNVLGALDRWDEAASAYQQAIDLAPGHPSAHCNLGVMLRLADRFAEAETALRQAIALDPGLAEAHFNLGRTLTAQGQHEAAIAAYRETLRLRPDYAMAYKSLGLLFYKLNRSEEAAALFRDWLVQDPANPFAQHMRAAHSGCNAPDRAPEAYVIDLFDHYAESFDQHLMGPLDYRAPTLIRTWLVDIMGAPAARLDVLDAGCGTGLCGPLLRPYARRLVGVDLSPRMIERARVRGEYDELVVAELTGFLSGRSADYELIVCVDTLIYFGQLEPVLMAAAAALRPGGWLTFTVERIDDAGLPNDFRLDPSGRYRHSESYLRRVLAMVGMAVENLETVTLRLESGQPVIGFLLSARKLPIGDEIPA